MYDVIGIDECGTEVVMSTHKTERLAEKAADKCYAEYEEYGCFWVEVNARHAAEQRQQWLWENGYEDMY